MSSIRLPRAVTDLRPGDHACCFYETRQEHWACLAPFLREGLKQREKVRCAVDATKPQDVLDCLNSNGFDAQPYLNSGQLDVATSDEVYVPSGAFDPDRTIELLGEEVERAVAEGYEGFRTSGEMSWALADPPGAERLLEYEAKLTDSSTAGPCLHLCCYDRRRFSSEQLLDVLSAHPTIVTGADVFDNHYYVPTAMSLAGDRAAAIFRGRLHNLAARKEVIQELIATQARLEHLLTASPAALYSCEPDTRHATTFVSENVTRILGYEPHEFLEDPEFWFNHIHPSDRLRVLTGLADPSRPEAALHEYRFLHEDGAYRWISDQMRVVRDPRGAPQMVVGYWIDISDRRRAMEELQEGERKYRSLFSSAPVGIELSTPDGEVLDANRAMEVMTGYSLQQRRSAPLACSYAEPAEHGRLLRILEDTGCVRGAEVKLTRKDGARYDALLNIDRVELGGRKLDLTIAQDITERKRSEESLRRLEAAFNQSPDGIALTDMTGRIQFVNPAWARMHGYTPEELLGEHLSVFHTEEQIQREVVPFNVRVRREGSAEGEVAHLRRDGSVFLTSMTSALVRDANGEGIGMVGIARDVTSRKRAEEQLHKLNQFQQAVIDNANVWLNVVSDEGEVLIWNKAAEQISGYPRDEVVGSRNFTERLFPEQDYLNSIRDAAVARRRRNEEMDGFLADIRTKSGELKTISWYSRRLHDGAGDPIGSMALGLDVTEKKRVEDALRAGERRFREMSDLLPDMIYETDRDLRVTYANRAARENLGYTPEDIEAGVSLIAPLNDTDAARARDALNWAATTGEPITGDYDVNRRDGSVVPCEVHTAAIRADDGTCIGFRGVLRDITERRRAEEAERLAALGQLAAGVAHEFNNILASMGGRAQLADAKGDAEAYEKLIDTVLRSTARGSEISRNLIRFARPKEPVRKSVLIEAPIDAALLVAARELQNAQVQVVRSYDSLGSCVLGDAGQLEQVFLNLIINACHAMLDGGTLSIQTAVSPARGDTNEVVVTVSDTGVGISAEDLPHIFDPFFTTKGRLGESDLPGTGLGLSVSHGIISAHGGDITVRSEPGAGAAFEIRLAASERPVEDSAPAQAARLELGATDGAGRTVLIAEDEADLREVLVDVLGETGFRVVQTGTTQAAVDALSSERFDLVISDLMMPGGGGREVLAATLRLPEPPPVLLITGRAEEHLARELLDLGAKAYLRKPLGLEDVFAAIEEVIGEPEGA